MNNIGWFLFGVISTYIVLKIYYKYKIKEIKNNEHFTTQTIVNTIFEDVLPGMAEAERKFEEGGE